MIISFAKSKFNSILDEIINLNHLLRNKITQSKKNIVKFYFLCNVYDWLSQIYS
jgi:hypothetical protein